MAVATTLSSSCGSCMFGATAVEYLTYPSAVVERTVTLIPHVTVFRNGSQPITSYETRSETFIAVNESGSVVATPYVDATDLTWTVKGATLTFGTTYVQYLGFAGATITSCSETASTTGVKLTSADAASLIYPSPRGNSSSLPAPLLQYLDHLGGLSLPFQDHALQDCSPLTAAPGVAIEKRGVYEEPREEPESGLLRAAEGLEVEMLYGRDECSTRTTTVFVTTVYTVTAIVATSTEITTDTSRTLSTSTVEVTVTTTTFVTITRSSTSAVAESTGTTLTPDATPKAKRFEGPRKEGLSPSLVTAMPYFGRIAKGKRNACGTGSETVKTITSTITLTSVETAATSVTETYRTTETSEVILTTALTLTQISTVTAPEASHSTVSLLKRVDDVSWKLATDLKQAYVLNSFTDWNSAVTSTAGQAPMVWTTLSSPGPISSSSSPGPDVTSVGDPQVESSQQTPSTDAPPSATSESPGNGALPNSGSPTTQQPHGSSDAGFPMPPPSPQPANTEAPKSTTSPSTGNGNLWSYINSIAHPSPSSGGFGSVGQESQWLTQLVNSPTNSFETPQAPNAGNTAAQESSAVQVAAGGNTFSAIPQSGSVVLAGGSSTVTVGPGAATFLGQSVNVASGATGIVVGSSTTVSFASQTSQAVITANGQVLTAISSGSAVILQGGGSTITMAPGSTALFGGQVVSAASGGGGIVLASSTTFAVGNPSPSIDEAVVTANGRTFTAIQTANAVIIQDASSTVTVADGSLTVFEDQSISVGPAGSSMMVNGQLVQFTTVVVPVEAVVTAAGATYTAFQEGSAVVVEDATSTATIIKGSVATFEGDTISAPVSGSVIVVGSSTITLTAATTTGMGGYINSGLGGGVSSIAHQTAMNDADAKRSPLRFSCLIWICCLLAVVIA